MIEIVRDYEYLKQLSNREEAIKVVCEIASNHVATKWQEYCPKEVILKFYLTDKDFIRTQIGEKEFGCYKWDPSNYWSKVNQDRRTIEGDINLEKMKKLLDLPFFQGYRKLTNNDKE